MHENARGPVTRLRCCTICWQQKASVVKWTFYASDRKYLIPGGTRTRDLTATYRVLQLLRYGNQTLPIYWFRILALGHWLWYKCFCLWKFTHEILTVQGQQHPFSTAENCQFNYSASEATADIWVYGWFESSKTETTKGWKAETTKGWKAETTKEGTTQSWWLFMGYPVNR